MHVTERSSFSTPTNMVVGGQFICWKLHEISRSAEKNSFFFQISPHGNLGPNLGTLFVGNCLKCLELKKKTLLCQTHIPWWYVQITKKVLLGIIGNIQMGTETHLSKPSYPMEMTSGQLLKFFCSELHEMARSGNKENLTLPTTHVERVFIKHLQIGVLLKPLGTL